MMLNVSVGVVGAGAIGRHHARILKKLCGRVAVYDVNVSSARKVADELRLNLCESMDELLRKVDAVFVCTPPFAHEEVIKLACEEGKHVFCEKPLCVTVEEAERIVSRVRKAGVLFMMGFVLRFFPKYSKVKELVEEGRVGRIVNAWFFDVRKPYVKGVGGWRNRRKLNSGIFEQTVHEIDVIRWIVGEPATVYCAGGRYVLEELDYEDNLVYLMKMRNGAVTTLISSISAHAGNRDLGIIGDEGTIMAKGSTVYLNDREISLPRWDPFEKEDSYFLECVKKGEKPFVNEVDGYRAQVVNEASLESLSKRREVPVVYKF